MGDRDSKIDNSDRLGEMGENLSKINLSGMRFITPKASVAFTSWRKVFIEALILYYFDPECLILIETDTSAFAIAGILSWLTSEYGTYTNIDLSTSEISQ